MKIKTSNLTGPALDWAVAKCEGHDVVVLTIQDQEDRWFENVAPDKLAKERDGFERYIRETLQPTICVKGEEGYKRRPMHSEAAMLYGEGMPTFAYSTSWAQGGPIIEREEISIRHEIPAMRDSIWQASPSRSAKGAGGRWGVGPTPLIAAMRCYVASQLGDEVDVPEELK